MKGNFRVDPSYPVIDANGHSDKVDVFRVKGGGATNTTLFDNVDSALHMFECSRSAVVVSSAVYNSRLDPDIALDGSGFPQLSNPDCLNAIPQGDYSWCRGSDRILMNSIRVSGCVRRGGGIFSSFLPPDGVSDFPYYSPKCFVALVLDTQTRYAAPPVGTIGSALGPFINASIVEPGTGGVHSLSWLPRTGITDPDRYKVLAYDVLDFDGPLTRTESTKHTDCTDAAIGDWTMDTDVVRTTYSWPAIVKGFQFDVDLNDIICSFLDNQAPTVAVIGDNSLHMYVLNFNGVRRNGFALSPVAPDSFEYLSAAYDVEVRFRDFLVPHAIPVPPGADGDPVPPDEEDLAVLADESVKLGGGIFVEGKQPRRKKLRKGDVGFYNFVGRGDDALMNFPDDPEVARLPVPGTRGADYGRRKKAGRYDNYQKMSGDSGERDFKRRNY